MLHQGIFAGIHVIAIGHLSRVTQQMFKDRMAGHFALLSKYMREHKDSSSLVKHLAQKDHWSELAQGEIPTPKQLQAKLIVNVVYQGNPISAVRSFGTIGVTSA
eukprot:11655558-Ditylum_brightwellii.AAC.1